MCNAEILFIVKTREVRVLSWLGKSQSFKDRHTKSPKLKFFSVERT